MIDRAEIVQFLLARKQAICQRLASTHRRRTPATVRDNKKKPIHERE